MRTGGGGGGGENKKKKKLAQIVEYNKYSPLNESINAGKQQVGPLSEFYFAFSECGISGSLSFLLR